MSHRSRRYSALADRDRMRRRGVESVDANRPLFALPRMDRTPQPPKDEIRAQAEAALREWNRRFDPRENET